MSTVFPFSRPSTQPSPSPPMGIQPCTGTPPLRSQSHNLFHLFQHKLILLFHLLLLILCYISAKSRALLVEFLSSILYSTCVLCMYVHCTLSRVEWFLKIKCYTLFVVPNGCRTSIPEFLVLMLHGYSLGALAQGFWKKIIYYLLRLLLKQKLFFSLLKSKK